MARGGGHDVTAGDDRGIAAAASSSSCVWLVVERAVGAVGGTPP
jgi:hypothetical protein